MDGRKGTLKECVLHWIDREGQPAIPLLTKFLGRRWRKDSFPKGFDAIKLTMLMQLIGYDVSEAAKVDADIAVLNRGIAFGVVKPEELITLLSLRYESVLRVMRGGAGTSAKRTGQLRRRAKEVREKVDAAEAVWKERVEQLGTTPAVTREPESPPAPAKIDAGTVISRKLTDSAVTLLNTIRNIASAGIDPSSLSPDVKYHFAVTVAALFRQLGIDAREMEEILRRQHALAAGSTTNLAKILGQFPGGR